MRVDIQQSELRNDNAAVMRRVAASDPMTQLSRRRRVQAILDRFEVLSFDVMTAEYYWALAGLVRQRGRNPRPRRLDLQIVATATRHGLMLLTRNGSDFTGLQSALAVVDLPDRRQGTVGQERRD